YESEGGNNNFGSGPGSVVATEGTADEDDLATDFTDSFRSLEFNGSGGGGGSGDFDATHGYYDPTSSAGNNSVYYESHVDTSGSGEWQQLQQQHDQQQQQQHDQQQQQQHDQQQHTPYHHDGSAAAYEVYHNTAVGGGGGSSGDEFLQHAPPNVPLGMD